MASALQQQLAVIAANSTHQLNLKAQRAAHGKSLLFDAKVAVSQDFDSLYQLCVEGFHELCSLDNRFLQYAPSLFSEQSKSEERGQWTAEQNANFDRVVVEFLGLVQARLLLKPAQKAVEWLIRRFRIHELNTEATILTFLPYHSTPLFQSLLLIIPPSTTSSTFRFLNPYLTTLSNPPFPTIIHTVINNASFASAFNKYFLAVCRAGHHSSVLISFWSSVMAQAVEGMINNTHAGREAVQRQRAEELLLRLLPILNETLSFTNIPDLAIGSCMIITILAVKGHFGDVLLNGLMEAVATAWTPSSVDARLSCLAVLAQERQATKLPRGVVKRMLQQADLKDHLVRLSSHCRCDRLATGLVLGCLERLTKKSIGQELMLVDSIIRSNLLDGYQLNAVMKLLVTSVEHASTTGSLQEPTQTVLGGLLDFVTQSALLQGTFEKALKKTGVKRDAIEMALQRTFSYPALSVRAVEMTTVGQLPATRSILFESALESASKVASVTSFLSTNVDEPFQSLLDACLRSLGSEDQLEKFTQLKPLQPSKAYDTATYVSFFIRVWTSNSPQVARAVAPRIIATFLSRPVSIKYDFQLLIPYLFCGLADDSSAVRRATADAFKALVVQYREKATAKTSPHLIWGETDLHPGIHHQVTPISHEDAYYLVRHIIAPNLEACVLDAGVIVQVLQKVLDASTEIASASKNIAVSEMKSSRRAAYFSFFAEVVSCTSSLQVQTTLLRALTTAGKAGLAARKSVLVPFLRHWIYQSVEDATERCKTVNLSVKDIDDTFMQILVAQEAESMELLQQLLAHTTAARRFDVFDAALRRLRTLWGSIPKDIRRSISIMLLDHAVSSRHEETSALEAEASLETLQALPMTTDVLAALLASLPAASFAHSTAGGGKKRKTSREDMLRVEVSPDETAASLRRFTVVLDIVENSRPATRPELLKPLFFALSEIQQYRQHTDSDLIYLQGLTINCLLAIVDAVKDSKDVTVDKGEVRTDLLIDCIRNTNSPQVQNSALLLVSCLAVWVPDLVLHSVMPIFTFMGNTILRQTDEYSAHVIDQTVARVLPPLVTSLKKRSHRVITGASDLLLSFTAAFEHMPQNRRLVLFEHVVRILGPDECLFAIIAMIVDRYPTDNRAKLFVVDLLLHFEPASSLRALRQLIGLVADIFKPRHDISETVLHLKSKSKEMQHATALALLGTIASLAENQKIRIRVAKSLEEVADGAPARRKEYASLVQDAIQLSESIKTGGDIQRASSAVLSGIFKLTPLSGLIQSSNDLLSAANNSIRLTLLGAINSQVTNIGAVDLSSRAPLLQLIPQLTSIIENSKDPLIGQATLGLLDAIFEKFGKHGTDVVLAATPIIIGHAALGQKDERVRVMALLCLATVIDVVRDEFIPLFPDLAKQVIAYGEESLVGEDARGSLLNACLAVCNALLEYLPYLLGDFLRQIISIAVRAAESDAAAETKQMRQEFYGLFVARVNASEAFAALQDTYPVALNEGFIVMAETLKVFKAVVDSQRKSAIVKSSGKLFDLLLEVLDLRRVATNGNLDYEYDEEEVEQIENLVIEITVAITLKLNDATFRPFFARLVEWSSAATHMQTASAKVLRSTSFFRLLQALYARLKSLITSYAGYCIDLSVDLLGFDPTDEHGDQLFTALLGALEQGFEHDDDDFWQSPSHFDPIVTPLVSLIPKTTKDGDLLTSTISTLVSLAAAASSAEHHKTLNSELLKLLKDDEAAVRLAAVRCEHALTERLAEEWLDLLPELLPVIVELMEDDDENVEMEARRWVGRIETVLGEKLDDMLQ